MLWVGPALARFDISSFVSRRTWSRCEAERLASSSVARRISTLATSPSLMSASALLSRAGKRRRPRPCVAKASPANCSISVRLRRLASRATSLAFSAAAWAFLSAADAQSSLRFTMGRQTTKADVQNVVKTLVKLV